MDKIKRDVMGLNDNDLKKELDKANEEEKRLMMERLKDADDKGKKQQQLRDCVRAMDNLRNAIPNLSIVLRNSAELEQSISRTRDRADKISSKVRKLDLARSRAVQALARVRCIIDLKECINGVQKALMDSDYALGAHFVHKFHQVSDAFSALSEASLNGSSHTATSDKEKGISASSTTSSSSSLSNHEKQQDAIHSIDQDMMKKIEGELKSGILRQLSDQSTTLLSYFDPFAPISSSDKEESETAWLDAPVLLEVEKSYSVLAKLGSGQEALELYSNLLKQVLSKRIEKELVLSAGVHLDGNPSSHSSSSPDRAPFADILKYVFNSAAAMTTRIISRLNKNDAFKGLPCSSIIIHAVHSETDKLCCFVFSLYLKARKIREKAKIATRPLLPQDLANNPSLHPSVIIAQQIIGSLIDENPLVTLNNLLIEICLMLQYTENFDRFIRSKAASTSVDKPLPMVEYNRLGQEICGLYTTLESAWLQASLHRAVGMEKLVQIAQPITDASAMVNNDSKSAVVGERMIMTSSFVDDAFYIIGQIVQRSLATGSADAACGCINHICSSLEEIVLDHFKQASESIIASLSASSVASVLSEPVHIGKLREISKKFIQTTTASAASTASDAIAQQQEAKEREELIFSLLNSIHFCMEYTSQLHGHVMSQVDEVLMKEELRTKLRNCAESLQDEKRNFYQLLSSSLEKYAEPCKAKIKEYLERTFSNVSGISYELDEASFDRVHTSDPYVAGLVVILDEFFGDIFNNMSQENLFWMVERLGENVAKGIEHGVVRKRFTQLGALQLDKEVRVLTSYFGSRAEACGGDALQVKRKFQRLNEMASLLSVDSFDEVHEVWSMLEHSVNQVSSSSRGAQSSGLGAKEAKRVLALRIDFKADEIQKIKLV